ncbi:hypothetical protein HDU97_004925 [Phlyctochytrium planicorne]|nr:hypothetical protein HDU97_004925 [Phlyctochytrium planicorne]
MTINLPMDEHAEDDEAIVEQISMELLLSDLNPVEQYESETLAPKDDLFLMFQTVAEEFLDSEGAVVPFSELGPLLEQMSNTPELSTLASIQPESLSSNNGNGFSLERIWELLMNTHKEETMPSEKPLNVKSWLPRPIATASHSPSNIGSNASDNSFTPPRASRSPKALTKSPPSFGRKRTTPVANDQTSARKAFETSKSKSSASASGTGGLVMPAMEYQQGLHLEPYQVSEVDAVGPDPESRSNGSSVRNESSNDDADAECSDGEGRSGDQRRVLIHNRVTTLYPHPSTFSTPGARRGERDDGDVFHTPMTTMATRTNRRHNLHQTSPTPAFIGSYGERDSSQTTVLSNSAWSGNVSFGHSTMTSSSSNTSFTTSPASGRITPKTFRDFICNLKKMGFSDDVVNKAVRSTDEEEASSDDVTMVEFGRMTKLAINLTRKLKDREKELEDAYKNSERDIRDLQNRIEDLELELSRKKKQITSFRSKEKELNVEIDLLNAKISNLEEELQMSRIHCGQLKEEIGKHNSLQLELSTELKRKEEAAAAAQFSLENMEKDLNKNLKEKEDLQTGLNNLREEVAKAESLTKELSSENSGLKASYNHLSSSYQELQKEIDSLTCLGVTREYPSPKRLNLELDNAHSLHNELPGEPFSNTDPTPATSDSSLQTDPIPPSPKVPIADAGTQIDAVQFKDAAVGTNDFVPMISFEVGSQTDPDLAKWRPMPILSDSDRSLDVNFPSVPLMDATTQFSPLTLSVGVQSGNTVDYWNRHTHVQTEETAESFESKEKSSDALRLRCFQLEKMVKILESESKQIGDLNDEVETLEMANAELSLHLREVQGIAQENRRRLNVRKHFDAEVERWIANLRLQIDSINETMDSAKDALDFNTARQALAISKIETLEAELQRYEDLTLDLKKMV